MLLTHMEKRDEAEKIAKDLNTGFFAHGDAISRTRALELHLKVADRNAKLEELMWQGYLGLESHMELRRPFNALEIYLADPAAAAALRPLQSPQIPPTAPAQIAQQIWQTWANQVLQNATTPAVEARFSLVNAVIESARIASEFRTSGTILAFRGPDGGIKVALTPVDIGWKTV